MVYLACLKILMECLFQPRAWTIGTCCSNYYVLSTQIDSIIFEENYLIIVATRVWHMTSSCKSKICFEQLPCTANRLKNYY